ncbi:hypothetical protein KC19_2G117800 [Ceratodon purpureus]|uniref:Uncharacterized protein n=1 Tax=Ceratodon purpureus TaxID=3225 RepID=A0A8T0ISV1_CERPU|nr:hypothetical protein KC19_2G117800 [Ceratodon purpureus]
MTISLLFAGTAASFTVSSSPSGAFSSDISLFFTSVCTLFERAATPLPAPNASTSKVPKLLFDDCCFGSAAPPMAALTERGLLIGSSEFVNGCYNSAAPVKAAPVR